MLFRAAENLIITECGLAQLPTLLLARSQASTLNYKVARTLQLLLREWIYSRLPRLLPSPNHNYSRRTASLVFGISASMLCASGVLLACCKRSTYTKYLWNAFKARTGVQIRCAWPYYYSAPLTKKSQFCSGGNDGDCADSGGGGQRLGTAAEHQEERRRKAEAAAAARGGFESERNAQCISRTRDVWRGHKPRRAILALLVVTCLYSKK